MNKTELQKLIGSKEDDRHDFKEQWYEPGKDGSDKAEMLKDIFSFVNTVHNEDCYLIFGVTDGTHEVVGAENSTNRYNTQQITDWLSKLPIQPETPRVRIDTVNFQNHEVDIMVIQNTDKVPVFLDSEKGVEASENIELARDKCSREEKILIPQLVKLLVIIS